MVTDTKLSLLMKSLTKFYSDRLYIDEIRSIVGQKHDLSLRILDWFITNFSKKYGTVIEKTSGDRFDVYMEYKLMLKSFSKKQFDPFCRKNKIIFFYTETESFETSCGQLCFFRWCFNNEILDYVKIHFKEIEDDMKESILRCTASDPDKRSSRQPLSIPASRSITKRSIRYTLKFE
jgi:hypothetical protein